ncbi:hypothetical protein A2524_00925 [Candidatus Wolfebacteria bacterium RIFOXYD12_FULL_48_21]|uniref:Uncharacterized protein n=1 Tax=Candidatus Wolfebacteria bacterium RIFOXYD1_FULL_48_65 TaxID=1802561 RepID=A0A1F8E1Y9_9BACT|nr:MAG: hypothetical protein A2610_02870 [Candidatus Wolfebacteria bacterium RIFOXYD1_FULL_48_65]OGM94371.1 MAG: hypothetical protein A2524_00925 [Candidatus Wolfebacteria bacterium RIFOXYD12_FULL_48_21]OGM96941.1 MAG: hypothetical protein A2532_01280 [Candidatus Wolfebacteria bacterium RIFOXYD2_FULL_48_11]
MAEEVVIPAEAGIQVCMHYLDVQTLDTGLRRYDSLNYSIEVLLSGMCVSYAEFDKGACKCFYSSKFLVVWLSRFFRRKVGK